MPTKKKDFTKKIFQIIIYYLRRTKSHGICFSFYLLFFPENLKWLFVYTFTLLDEFANFSISCNEIFKISFKFHLNSVNV